ncbi:hypothetical protein GALMADRAFT_275455 [Galerina marginata CBS 339.88]|uniref:deuterolysin n=1 Tax=Galerina marginata (strain CBS 339.88) TaxID=685588 RepID=A0A067TML0_GALM3|nr:hypothetical protein GALMADRAFT_275455 [Galerina marginata CBS 339.88]
MLYKAYIVCFSLLGFVFATPLKRADGIVVSLVAAASSVDSLDDLKFTATVTNTGAEAVKILKYGTVLDEKLPTKSLVVTKDGAPVSSTGIKLSVSLAEVDESAFAAIAPGESITVSHEGKDDPRFEILYRSDTDWLLLVGSLYDFASSGVGKYTFQPITNFIFADAAEGVPAVTNIIKAQAATNSVEVEIKGGLHMRELKKLDARARDICTTASKKSFIDATFTEAKSLASISSSYISSRGSADALYKAYFGTTATSRVTSILNAVANENSSSRTLSCIDSLGACSSGVIAYTATSTTNVYFCSIFFDEVATSRLCSGTFVASRNVRGGTTLHELTHAVGGTDDVTYGCSADQGLSNANKAINSDNYNCFTTQVYANTRC